VAPPKCENVTVGFARQGDLCCKSRKFCAPHSVNIASSWYAQAQKLRKLQNQNVLLNRLAKKYGILPEGANLSVEIVREILTAGHLFFENSVPSCWPCHLNTTKSEKS